MTRHYTDRCSYCGQPGHLGKDCRWPRWHRRFDDGSRMPLWLRIVCWLCLPIGFYLYFTGAPQ